MVAYKMTEEDQDLPSTVDALVVGTAFAEAAVADSRPIDVSV